MKFLSRIMTLAAAIAVSISLTACGGDDNDEPDNPSKVVFESVTAAYEVSLSDAYLKFYDATIVFTDADGNLKQAPLTKDEKFGYTIPESKLPEKICLAIQLKAKAQIPDFDSNATFKLARKVWLTVQGNQSDGQKVNGGKKGKADEVDLPGNKVTDYLKEKSEIVFGPYEFETEQFKNK